MKKTAIVYGSSSGTTEGVAKLIAGKLGIPANCVFDVSKFTTQQAEDFEVLILGTSTWGDGELQDDWYDGINTLKSAKLSGKLIALFGCGDSSAYSSTFCDGMGQIYEDLQGSGCNFIGGVSTDGYSFDSSRAVVDGKFVGAALDEMNEPDQTDARLQAWIDSFKDKLQ